MVVSCVASVSGCSSHCTTVPILSIDIEDQVRHSCLSSGTCEDQRGRSEEQIRERAAREREKEGKEWAEGKADTHTKSRSTPFSSAIERMCVTKLANEP